LNDDLPYLFKCRSRTLVEIPFTTSTADKTFIGYPYPQRGGADGLATDVKGNLYVATHMGLQIFDQAPSAAAHKRLLVLAKSMQEIQHGIFLVALLLITWW